jgi:hypothetical protein
MSELHRSAARGLAESLMGPGGRELLPRLAADLGPLDDGPGWIWTVYPMTSTDPMVGVGHSGTEDKAKEAAEHQMLSRPDAPFAIVIGPLGQHETARRTRDGGFRWRRLGDEPE